MFVSRLLDCVTPKTLFVHCVKSPGIDGTQWYAGLRLDHLAGNLPL